MRKTSDVFEAIDEIRDAVRKGAGFDNPEKLLILTPYQWRLTRAFYPELSEAPPSHLWGMKLEVIPPGEDESNG